MSDEEVAGSENVYRLADSGKWLGWLMRSLKSKD